MTGGGALHTIEDRRVAVTGAGGFIGAHLLRRLVAGGARVRALSGPVDAAVQEPPAEVEAHRGEIDDPACVGPLVDRTELVFHLAGPASVRESLEAPLLYARVHTCGTVAVLEACRRGRVGRLVYVSSAEVYGRPACVPVDESRPLQARSPYAAAKIAAERFVEAWRIAHRIEAVVLRPFSIYGPGQHARSLAGEAIAQALRGDVVEVSDPRPVRDYCFVEDLVDALIAAAVRPLADPAPVWNVGTGRGTSVAELVEAIGRARGRTLALRPRAVVDRPAHVDIPHLVADPTRIGDAIGWRASTSLEEGLRRTIEAAIEADHARAAGGTA